MSQLSPVKSGLDVGFAGSEIPACFASLKGDEGAWRSIVADLPFPFEDAQFEAVILHGSVVDVATVREAHRVLKPDGCLYFVVPEKTSGQSGFTMPEIYATVREGYNIIDVERPKWWRFGFGGKNFTIRARKKKNWNNLGGATYRPYL